jgi:hypothetical protein
MQKGQILDPEKAFMLECHKCHKSIFTVIIAGDGITCRCVNCHQPYKIESLGGVRIANA